MRSCSHEFPRLFGVLTAAPALQSVSGEKSRRPEGTMDLAPPCLFIEQKIRRLRCLPTWLHGYIGRGGNGYRESYIRL